MPENCLNRLVLRSTRSEKPIIYTLAHPLCWCRLRHQLSVKLTSILADLFLQRFQLSGDITYCRTCERSVVWVIWSYGYTYWPFQRLCYSITYSLHFCCVIKINKINLSHINTNITEKNRETWPPEVWNKFLQCTLPVLIIAAKFHVCQQFLYHSIISIIVALIHAIVCLIISLKLRPDGPTIETTSLSNRLILYESIGIQRMLGVG